MDQALTLDRTTPVYQVLGSSIGEEQLTALVASSRSDRLEEVLKPVAETANVLANPLWVSPLRWEDIKKLVPRSKDKSEPISNTQITQLTTMTKDLDQIAQEIFPPRTKIDLSIRRSRWPDLVFHFKRLGKIHHLQAILRSFKQGWDYIFSLNLVTAFALFGLDWFTRLKWLGAFDHDLTHYTNVTKEVSNILKVKQHHILDWRNYVELSNLTGYRNPPFPGFDAVVETEKLAEGGLDFNLLGHNWKDVVREALPMNYHRVNYLSFNCFVEGASWLTAGSSSVGKLHILADGKEIKVKCRKNTVADVVDLEELAQAARINDRQENYSIIKSELGKLRMAVASDIYTYLQMTWINYLLGGAYKDWPGSTIEEDPVTQSNRLARMLELAAKSFGLPYDYAAFDHQPTTEQLVEIVRHLIAHARLNVPDSDVADFDLIAQNVVTGFRKATLEVRADQTRKVFKVTGGVMSGLRWTTVLGNGWNSCMTKLVEKILTQLGVNTDTIARFIRGDDSAIFTDTWSTATLFDQGYKALGVQGGAGKYSIRYHEMEFLRVWFADKCYGYPARAIPGLTQRKPWSSSPWSEEMVIKAIYDTFRTLRRRLGDVDDLWNSMAARWCQLHRLPRLALQSPKFLGGLGVERPTFLYRCTPHIPTIDKPDIQITNQNSWRSTKLTREAYEKYNIVLPPLLASKMAHEQLLSTLAADDVPIVSRNMRDLWKAKIKTYRPKVERVHYGFIPNAHWNPFHVVSALPDQHAEMDGRIKRLAPQFGKFKYLTSVIQDYHTYKEATTLSLKQWINLYAPQLGLAIDHFHKRWHISEILDYLLGDISVQTSRLHPVLNSLLVGGAVSLQSKRKPNRGETLMIASIYEDQLYHTQLSQSLYLW